MSRRPTQSHRRPGRPPHARNARTIIKELAQMRIPASNEPGQSRSLAEALILLLQNLAFQGDIEADKQLDKIRAHVSPEEPPEYGVLLVPEKVDAETWIREAQIRNRYLEEPTMPDPPAKAAATIDQPVPKPTAKRHAHSYRVVPETAPRMIR